MAEQSILAFEERIKYNEYSDLYPSFQKLWSCPQNSILNEKVLEKSGHSFVLYVLKNLVQLLISS